MGDSSARLVFGLKQGPGAAAFVAAPGPSVGARRVAARQPAPLSYPSREAHVQDGEGVSHAVGFRTVERAETVMLVEADGLVVLLVHIH